MGTVSDTEKHRISKKNLMSSNGGGTAGWRITFGRVVVAIYSACGLSPIFAQEADILFLNANIYTGNEHQPRAEAVAVKQGRIIWVGDSRQVEHFRSAKTREIDLHGSTVVPGFTDSHVHIFEIGAREMNLNLEGANSREDFLNKVKSRAAQTAPGKWIVGRGWIETFWKPPEFPTLQDLDSVSPANPVFLTRADGHAAAVNSAALKIAGIGRDTANPFGGKILKDKNNEPTAMLLDNAQDLVAKQIPKPTQSERERALSRGIEREIGLGWCEIQNAGSHKEDIDLIRSAFESGKIKIRFINAVYGPGQDARRLLNDGATINAFDHHFTQRTIKVIFDGALGSRGAALLKPYNDASDTAGYLTQKPEELEPMFEEALRRGIQVETHAIGDRANRVILDLYERAFKAVPPSERKVPSGEASSGEPDSKRSREPVTKNSRESGVAELRPPAPGSDVRWRVEHAQILDPVDLPRFAKLGVIPSMQPSHAISDLFFAPRRLGMDRLAGAYAWQSLLKTGCIISGGSDAPVERGEPMIEFYAAVARRPLPGHSEGLPAEGPSRTGILAKAGWHPEQAVSRQQALKMFTIWPAYAAFEEKEKGTIEPGKLADLTVLSQDIMKIPEPEILKTRCVMTVIGGEIVFNGKRTGPDL